MIKRFDLYADIVEHDIEESNVPCEKINCTLCCENLSPLLTEEEFLSGKYVYTIINYNDRPTIAVPKADTGCFYFDAVKKQCKIYDIRPKSCRQFDCRKNHHKNIKNQFTFPRT